MSYSDELKQLLISASRGELSLTGDSVEDAGARWLAFGVMHFLKGSRFGYTMIYPTDVVVWKRLGGSYGEFDVQVGYAAKRKVTQSVSGRVTAFMEPAGDGKYLLRVMDWASQYIAYYMLQVINKGDDYKFEEAFKSGGAGYIPDWAEVPV